MSASDFLKDRKIAIATKHKKETIIKPLLEKSFGLKSVVPVDFDTDVLGTFTRDKKRTGDQLETARKKALMGMSLTGLDIAIASEGSFDSHPTMPFIPSNLELVLLVDSKHGIEVRGHSRTFETNMAQKYISSVSEAVSFAESVGFPGHGVIVREDENSGEMFKEIITWDEFKNVCQKLLDTSKKGRIFLETDMRAHRNPMRMKNIELALKDLIKNIENTCPECGMIGFVPVKTTGYIPCRACGRDTDVPGKYSYECQKCHYTEERWINEKTHIDPDECSYCNP